MDELGKKKSMYEGLCKGLRGQREGLACPAEQLVGTSSGRLVRQVSSGQIPGGSECWAGELSRGSGEP